MDEVEIDPESLYPWGGDFVQGDYQKNVAVVLLNSSFVPSMEVALYGKLKTENIGIEKIVANVISNPCIRFLVLCGGDIRGHRSGKSMVCLHENGIDENNRIIDAPGAIPYIENINNEAIIRFQEQVEIIDLIDVDDETVISKSIEDALETETSVFGPPFIAIRLVKESAQSMDDTRALHSRITLSYLGKVSKRG